MTHLSRIVATLLVTVLLLPAALAQESLIVPAKGGTVSVLDLETLNLRQTLYPASFQAFAIAGNNPRLGFIGGGGGCYLSVVDFSIGREVNRIYDVCPFSLPALTDDKNYLLVEDQFDSRLKVVDLSAQNVVRSLDLTPQMGTGMTSLNFGSIVVVGNKAYVTTVAPDPNRPAIAVIELKKYKAKAISIPAGYFENPNLWSPNAAATPDGKYVVMVQSSPDYTTYHLLFIDTATDRLALDKTLDFDPWGLLITPVNSAGNVYGYLLGWGYNGFAAMMIDLNQGSPTFGELLPESEVVLQSYFGSDYSAVLNPEGTRLVVGAGKNGQSAPNPNVVMIDTTQMLHNSGGAIKGTAIVSDGLNAHGMTIAVITSAPPSTAPTVAGVTSSITNDRDGVIHITGSNFAHDALVRVGTTPPLRAHVDSSTALHVTVPEDWPAQAKLDVVVTNPNPHQPPAQQYQSGLLAEALTILPTPAFQPNHLFASSVIGDYSVAVYNPTLRTMLDVPSAVLPYGIAFNPDGREIYSAGVGTRGLRTPVEAAAWNTGDGTLQAEVPFSPLSAIGLLGPDISASVHPFTGRPVVFVPIRTSTGSIYDVALNMIDTDASSPTFNQVLLTIPAGLNLSYLSVANVYASTATPDGRYAYVSYRWQDYSQGTEFDFLGIFDVVHGTVTSILANSLAIQGLQGEMTVTPDGQCLLMTPAGASLSTGSPIAVFDISTNPLNPTLLTTIQGKKPFYFTGWQVVGNKLFALDEGNFGAVVVFNFDRRHLDFRQLAQYSVGEAQNLGQYLGVSPDGALIYVPNTGYDMIAVLDTNRLISGRPPLITNIGGFRGPFQVVVSPTRYRGH